MALMILTAAIISTLMDAVMVESTAALPGIKHAIITHYLIVSDLGAAAGPIFGYVLIETAGLRMLGWTAAGVLVLAALLSGYSYRLELHSGAVKLKEIGLSDKVRSESGSC